MPSASDANGSSNDRDGSRYHLDHHCIALLLDLKRRILLAIY